MTDHADTGTRPCNQLGNSTSCAKQTGAVTDMWMEPCRGCLHDGTRRATGAELIEWERNRQIYREGWTPEHDDGHPEGDLLHAARAYAAVAAFVGTIDVSFAIAEAVGWPWRPEDWKPGDDPIRCLVKAGALIAAEVDRLLRSKETDG